MSPDGIGHAGNSAARDEASDRSDEPLRPAQRIRMAIDRSMRALELRPQMGRGTAVTGARLDEGLRCTVTEGSWTFAVDMSPKVGGEGAAPNPGVFARGALASCLTIGYAMWAARLGVELRRIEVRVEADYDVRGELGVGDGRPGYTELRYAVAVEAAPGVSEPEIQRVLDLADRHSSLRDVFSEGVPLRRVDYRPGGDP